MARILITSGPTRQYLDPVRYLSNASSGRMGACLAAAAIECGHQVVIVSGPVNVDYPNDAKIVRVTTTQEMLDAATEHFPACDGVIGAAAPCDFQPELVATQKLKKQGDGFTLKLTETSDILGSLGKIKRPQQWSVAFALETENGAQNAVAKLKRKNCDLVVLNDPSAIEANQTQIKILNSTGAILSEVADTKLAAAKVILDCIDQHILNA
jgi:phosphopantothenoylcysteine decarboxylase/phosphopantothenate--cysteine ligase